MVRDDPDHSGCLGAELHRIHRHADGPGQRLQREADVHELVGKERLTRVVEARPHNSGHWTLDAADCSQFEQQARVMAGLPLGSTAQVRPVIMLNILGNAWYPVAPPPAEPTEPDWSAVLAHPGAHLHLYGKDEARIGRKMGHVNIVADTLDAAREQAAAIGHQVAQPLVEG